ncbi:MAG: hypothetical protein CR962_00925, partial [Gammaproteobacteria bacterium]
NKRSFKKVMALVLTLALVVGLVPLGAFTAYAAGFNNVPLGGNVVANYNGTDLLTISGSGTIEYDKWVAMARKFKADYYGSDWQKYGWHNDVVEDFAIVFDGDADHAIKLCGTKEYGNGLFTNFSGAITFNKKVDLAPGVTDLSYMFCGASQFNQPIDHWDVSSVTNMNAMFREATAFNQPIGGWKVDNVTNMYFMFYGATAFNADISKWNTVNVTDMNAMFYDASAFNADISGWNTVNVTNMSGMFYGATAFNADISKWNTVNVTDMNAMFYDATAFNADISGWNTVNVKDMGAMFSGATAFNADISKWNTVNVTDMSAMFADASAFNADISGWNTVNVTNMSGMFYGATNYQQDIKFNISRLKDDPSTSWIEEGLDSAFYGCATSSIQLDAGTNSDINASDAFEGMANLSYLEFNGLKNAEIDGFSGDYRVKNITASTEEPKTKDESYRFNNNEHYIVTLQSPKKTPMLTVNPLTKAHDGNAIAVADFTAKLAKDGTTDVAGTWHFVDGDSIVDTLDITAPGIHTVTLKFVPTDTATYKAAQLDTTLTIYLDAALLAHNGAGFKLHAD